MNLKLFPVLLGLSLDAVLQLSQCHRLLELIQRQCPAILLIHQICHLGMLAALGSVLVGRWPGTPTSPLISFCHSVFTR